MSRILLTQAPRHLPPRLIFVVRQNQTMRTLTTEQKFTGAMLDIYRKAKTEADYVASRFLQMVHENGGFQTAHSLVHNKTPSEGYTELWKRKRLDLTVEALVLKPEWNELFTDEDRAAARKRLEDYGYDFGQK